MSQIDGTSVLFDAARKSYQVAGKKQVGKLIPKSCADKMPKSTPVASLLHVVFFGFSVTDPFLFDPPVEFHFEKVTL